MLGELNKVRANAGLGPLELRSDISAIATDWSQQMAAARSISHRPANQLSSMLAPGWRSWGENVAEAPSVEWAQSALRDSPDHYVNMVNPSFNVVGIGVVTAANGQVFVTQNFASY